MSFQSENERNKTVVDAFYQLGIQGRFRRARMSSFVSRSILERSPKRRPPPGEQSRREGDRSRLDSN
jgi:hypothetical protein